MWIGIVTNSEEMWYRAIGVWRRVITAARIPYDPEQNILWVLYFASDGDSTMMSGDTAEMLQGDVLVDSIEDLEVAIAMAKITT